jgi:hypothetical protein
MHLRQSVTCRVTNSRDDVKERNLFPLSTVESTGSESGRLLKVKKRPVMERSRDDQIRRLNREVKLWRMNLAKNLTQHGPLETKSKAAEENENLKSGTITFHGIQLEERHKKCISKRGLEVGEISNRKLKHRSGERLKAQDIGSVRIL